MSFWYGMSDLLKARKGVSRFAMWQERGRHRANERKHCTGVITPQLHMWIGIRKCLWDARANVLLRMLNFSVSCPLESHAMPTRLTGQAELIVWYLLASLAYIWHNAINPNDKSLNWNIRASELSRFACVSHVPVAALPQVEKSSNNLLETFSVGPCSFSMPVQSSVLSGLCAFGLVWSGGLGNDYHGHPPPHHFHWYPEEGRVSSWLTVLVEAQYAFDQRSS